MNDSTGEEWDTDRYNPEDDKMFYVWIEDSPFGMSWVDNIILCDDDGISSIASDIERLGVLGNGDTTDTRLEGTDSNNSTSEPPNAGSGSTSGSTNGETNGQPTPPGG